MSFPIIVAIIPARGGSKGIPRKNLISLVGMPLVAHSVAQARQTPGIARVFVSTDDAEIAAISRGWGAEVVPRPQEISGDKASSESALLHGLDYLKQIEGDEPDLVVFLQATSPCRAPGEIRAAIDTLISEDADSLLSVGPVHGFVWRVEKNGSVRSFSYDHLNRPRRQDAPEDLIENGSIYIFKPWVLRKFNNRLGGKIALHRMSALDSFQIDEPGDFELLEYLMKFQDAKRKAQSAERDGQSARSGEERAEGGNLKPETEQGAKGDAGGAEGEGGSKGSEAGSAKGEAEGFRPHPSPPSSLSPLLSSIKLLVLDFDGVMTDNRVLVTEEGKEAVLCHRGDGLGLEMLRAKGIEAIVISKEKNPVVAARCRKLGIECIQGCDNKLEKLKKRAESGNLKPEEISYVGNDVNDLECMGWVGLPIAVSDAEPEVLAVAKWVTSKPGGHGAVREVCDAIRGEKGGAQGAER